jgi:hypothetical protein
LKPNPFPRGKKNNNIRNYDYLNIPLEFSPYRIRLPKINYPRIKHKVASFSEKFYPEIYGKKEVVYDNFSRMYVSDTKSVDSKRLILNPMLSKLLMTDMMKRKNMKPVQNYVSGRSSASSDIGEELRVEILEMKNVENLYEKNEESKRSTQRGSPSKKVTNSFSKIKKVNDNDGEYNKEYVKYNIM